MSLFTSILNAFSGDKAAKVQERANTAAANLQKEQYAQTRADLGPYRDAGTTALSTYRDLLGQNGQDAAGNAWKSYTESPELPGILQKVRDNVQASNAARGGLFSGATAEEIGDRSTQTYLEDSNNWLNRIRDVAGQGQNAAAQTGTFGANSAQLQGQYLTQAGEAKATQAIQPALQYNNFLNNIYKGAGMVLGQAGAGGAFGPGGAFSLGK